MDFSQPTGQLTEHGGLGATTLLTTVTANASANTKGSATGTILTAGFPYQGISVNFSHPTSSGGFLVDILVNGQVAIPNILTTLQAASVAYFGQAQYFPLHVPKGATITARCQCTTGGNTVRIGIRGFAGGFGFASGLQFCEALGAQSSGASRGTPVDCGAATNTKGSWTSIGTLTRNCNFLAVALGVNEDVKTTGMRYAFDIGIGSSPSGKDIVVPNICFGSNPYFLLPFDIMTYPVALKSGVTLYARGQSTTADATDRIFDVALYAMS